MALEEAVSSYQMRWQSGNYYREEQIQGSQPLFRTKEALISAFKSKNGCCRLTYYTGESLLLHIRDLLIPVFHTPLLTYFEGSFE